MPTPVTRSESLSSAPSRTGSARGVRKAVLLTTDFPPQIGGIAEYLDGLWRELLTWTSASVYTTIHGDGPDRPTVHRLPAPPQRCLGRRVGDGVAIARRINTLAYFASSRRYARRALAPLLPKFDPSSRVCIGLWNPLAHFWCEALREAGRSYALFAYGVDVIQPLYRTIDPWRTADFRSAARVIACSSGTAELAGERLGIPEERLRVINPGLTVAGYRAPCRDAIAAVRASLGIDATDKVALSVGRLVKRKGFDAGLRAFAAFRHQGGRAVYVVAGDGPERTPFEALAVSLGVENDVRFTGAPDEVTKFALYELCDLFVMPNSVLDGSDWEGFGIVFLEAARAGKPSLGGNNGGVPDAVANGITGVLVDTADQGQIDRAFASLMGDDALREKLGAAARDRAVRDFDWPMIGDQFRLVLEESW